MSEQELINIFQFEKKNSNVIYLNYWFDILGIKLLVFLLKVRWKYCHLSFLYGQHDAAASRCSLSPVQRLETGGNQMQFHME